jgi:hypothetical protein
MACAACSTDRAERAENGLDAIDAGAVDSGTSVSIADARVRGTGGSSSVHVEAGSPKPPVDTLDAGDGNTGVPPPPPPDLTRHTRSDAVAAAAGVHPAVPPEFVATLGTQNCEFHTCDKTTGFDRQGGFASGTVYVDGRPCMSLELSHGSGAPNPIPSPMLTAAQLIRFKDGASPGSPRSCSRFIRRARSGNVSDAQRDAILRSA